LHREVVQVMKEVGIDLSTANPQQLTEQMVKDADLLITLGCGEACPYVPGIKRDDWPLPDPKGKDINEVRRIRDNIRAKVAGLAENL
jgi:arsenate reductase (thioredoxin)